MESGEERHKTGYFDHIQIWYDKIKEFTFETKFLALSKEEAIAMKKYRESARQLGALLSFTNDISTVSSMDPMDMIGPDQKQIIERTTERLNEVIERFAPSSCFVRLSTRSPKDAVLNSSKAKHLIHSAFDINKLNNNNNNNNNNNKRRKSMSNDDDNNINIKDKEEEDDDKYRVDDVILYWRAISKAQEVKSGKEAMDLMLRSNRVCEDISRAELHLEKEEDWDMQLIVRRWEEIDPEMEFRCFVLAGKLIGITQYHKTCFVPYLHHHRDRFKQIIVDYFDQIKDKLKWVPNESYTIDFSFTQSEENNHNVKVVEINSYPPIAGTSLFDWDNPADRNFLIGGGDLDFRVLSSPVEWKSLTDLHPPLKLFIEQLRSPSSDQSPSPPPSDSKCILQ